MADLIAIEKAIEGLQEKMATKNEVKTLIADELKKDEERARAAAEGNEKALKATQAELATQQLTTKDLLDQVKYLRANRFAAMKGPDGNYRGIWPSAQSAKAFGLFIMGHVMKNPQAAKALETEGIEVKGIVGGEVKVMTSNNLTTGAALVPTEFIPTLTTLIESYSAYRQLAQIYPLSASEATTPIQTGDPTVYCPGAGVAPTASNLTLGQVTLAPLEWLAYVAVNNDLMADSAIALGELVGRSLARAFANKEDQCGFIGDGTKAYFNIIGARAALRAVDATVTNVKGLKVQDTAGAWSSIDLQDLLAVAGLLPDYAELGNDIAWVTSKAFYLTVMVNAALTAGGAFAAEVMRPNYLSEPVYLGRPVRFGGGMPKVKEAADHCPLLYGNWKLGAVYGNRQGFEVRTSTEAAFTTSQTLILGSERVAISVPGVGNTTAAGPIVGLWADIA